MGNGGGAGFLTAIPDFRPVIPHIHPVIPHIHPVIPDSYPVIPAKAGIHSARPRENGDCERRWDARGAVAERDESGNISLGRTRLTRRLFGLDVPKDASKPRAFQVSNPESGERAAASLG